MRSQSPSPLGTSLQLLEVRPALWGAPSTHEKLQALQVVAARGQPRDLARFYRHALDRRADTAEAAAAAVGSIMSRVRPAEWTRLYPYLRNILVKPAELSRPAAHDGPDWTHVLGIATFSGNGYVRQAALQMLADRPDPEAMPYFLLRLADWVAPVRVLAGDLVARRLTREYVRTLLKHRSLIDWLARVRRIDLTEVRKNILALLRSDEAREEVIAALEEPSYRVRLFCFELAEDQMGSRPELLIRAARDQAAEIRAWAASHLPGAQDSVSPPILTDLLKDRSARVRAAVLQAVPDELWEHLQERVAALLFDRSASVRREARRLLACHREINVAELYRAEAERRVEMSPGVIAGLGEVGSAGDARLIEPMINEKRPSMRATALAALARVKPDAVRPQAIELLADPSGRVRRTAITVLNERCRTEELPSIRMVLQTQSASARKAALRVIARYGGWEALADVLWALLQDDADLAAHGQELLRRWLDRSTSLWQKPAPEALGRSRDYLERLRHQEPTRLDLSSHDWQLLEFILDQAGKLM